MSATPVVLLHGVGLDRTVWQPVQDALDLPSLALDLPGHGAQPPLTAPATLAGLADDVLARMPDAPVHLVGFSLGALIAQHIARYAPQRVRTLTSVSSVCRRTPAERAAVRARLDTARRDFSATVEASLARWFPDDSTPPELSERTRRVLEGNDPDSFCHAYAVFAEADAVIGPELPLIAVPSLAVTGALDPGSTPEMTRRLASAIPGCRAEIVPGAHHLLPVENPRALCDALIPLFTAA